MTLQSIVAMKTLDRMLQAVRDDRGSHFHAWLRSTLRGKIPTRQDATILHRKKAKKKMEKVDMITLSPLH